MVTNRANPQLPHLIVYAVLIATCLVLNVAAQEAAARSSTAGDTAAQSGDSAFNQVLTLLKQSHEKQGAGQLDEAISLANRAATKNNEGVHGLRRALVLASAESQVVSLWQVSDAATRDLMSDYYRRLQAGEGRTDALRSVQLSMIATTASGLAPSQSGASGGKPSPREQCGLGMSRSASTKGRTHPFYWASFIQFGDWRSLDMQK